MAKFKIQDSDIKSSAELVSAGGTAAQLPNDTKVYVTANGLNKTLYQAVVDGDFASGTAASQVRLSTGNGFGSSSTKIRRWTTTEQNVGSAITYADSATLGATFTINTTGVYAITYTEEGDTGAPLFGISLNATGGDLTSNLNDLSISKILTITNTNSGNYRNCCSWVGKLTAGDVIRCHTNNGGGGTFADNVQVFTISTT